MLLRRPSYQETCDAFRWEIPQDYNIALDVCDRHATGRARRALIYHQEETGATTEYSFHQLRNWSNRLAAALRSLGIERGDRIAIVLPQSPEAALTHLASSKLGAVAVPLFCLFGPDALHYRLSDSGAKAVFVNAENLEKITAIRSRLPSLSLRARSPVRAQSPVNFSRVARGLFQYSRNMTGFGLLTAISPISPAGAGLPSSPITSTRCPGIGRPMDPGLISMTS